MVQQAVIVDPCVVLGRLAVCLAEGGSLPEALDLLVDGLGLRSTVLRSASGELLAIAGEVVHAVPSMRAVPDAHTTLELPVVGRGDLMLATLSVTAARPSQLPALRAAVGEAVIKF